MKNAWRAALAAFIIGAAPLGVAFGQPALKEPAPPVALRSLPRFRGFNLLEKFTAASNQPFREDDFKLIAGLGFNFVRLPLDYRCFVTGENAAALDEKTMREIDDAVQYGLKYKIHVSLNFHRAPGYCVNPPAEKTDLWTAAAAQERFARLWGLFAARYRGISSRSLSFNLVNEPPSLEHAIYAAVMRRALRAIRAEDPHRLVFIDGIAYGRVPVSGLDEPWIIQAARGYAPTEVTHYQASWMEGADRFPAPVWPMYRNISAWLYGPEKKEYQSALVLAVAVERETRLGVLVHQVSGASRLVVKADGKIVLDKAFRPGPGRGEWSKVVYEKRWNVYQNIYDKNYSCAIPAGARRITLENTEGDWLSFSELTLEPYAVGVKAPVVLAAGASGWGEKQGEVRLTPAGTVLRDKADILYDARWLKNDHFAPWIEFNRKGGTVMVTECGVYNRTPHAVTLAFLEDLLKTIKAEAWGWALWNFRGSFGPLDSGRADVFYEDFHGHKLDRKMLDLLLKY